MRWLVPSPYTHGFKFITHQIYVVFLRQLKCAYFYRLRVIHEQLIYTPRHSDPLSKSKWVYFSPFGSKRFGVAFLRISLRALSKRFEKWSSTCLRVSVVWILGQVNLVTPGSDPRHRTLLILRSEFLAGLDSSESPRRWTTNILEPLTFYPVY